MTMLRLALVEPRIGRDPQANFRRGRAGVLLAFDTGASVVALPELWITGFAGTRIRSFLADPDFGPGALRELEGNCQRRAVDLVHGFPEEAEQGQFYNCLRLGSQPNAPVYRKLMVYTDVEKNFMSAVRSQAPSAIAFHHTFDSGQVTIGAQLCADLRFPELSRVAGRLGAKVILNCSQWRSEPRLPDEAPAYPEHWSVLLRARAIENQCYMAGCGASGTAHSYYLLGESMVVDPLGVPVEPTEILPIPDDDSGRVLVFDLDLSRAGGQAHAQARPFVNWIDEVEPTLRAVYHATRAHLEGGSPDPGRSVTAFIAFSAADEARALAVLDRLRNEIPRLRVIDWRWDLKPGRVLRDEILRQLAQCHVGLVFVSTEAEPRPNVILELGVMIGKLGVTRTFVIASPATRLPSDLDGVLRLNPADPSWVSKLNSALPA